MFTNKRILFEIWDNARARDLAGIKVKNRVFRTRTCEHGIASNMVMHEGDTLTLTPCKTRKHAVPDRFAYEVVNGRLENAIAKHI